ncbi:PREDICTED: laminin subunit alpha [Ceratosolen solmsi marchali]|uniref:Laminin subunit alpha n=1 Tax=Ceratosolen solmsi marchali TaxID=326594 RepID=A0AAJ6VN62_9HYME|nr:PREDICTED: laminin subunit alpha [Ceratosolen solmsi marchali]
MGGRGAASAATAVAALLLAALLTGCQAEILTPPSFNLAEGKEIVASATCGVESAGPELYCQLVGANSDQEANINQNIIQGQQCDYCDPNDSEKRHPPEYAVDGMETWWQSPPLSRGKKYEEVNLTINLGQEFHVAYVYVRMGNSPRPGLWILEKSKDYGKSWSPWQYFSDSESDCMTYFGIDSHTPITRDDSVICTTEYSKLVPLEGGEIPISILNSRPSAKHYFNSTVLQEWTRATNVRFRFLKTKNLLGHLMSVRRQDPTVTRRYFYSIKDISIGGRCMCNGHADTCDSLDPNLPNKFFCRCQHNTCGPQCATCCKGFEQKKWRQSTYSKKFVCEECNCFDHSTECIYDTEIDEKHLSLDIHGNYEGGGVCQNCRHNTEGINCNRCKPKFYRPTNKPLNATDVCQPCNCDYFYSTGNCFDSTGQCECRPEYTAPNCDSCSYGYFGFPDCRPCECHLNGTYGYHCEATEGQCPCKENYAGHYCNFCAEEYYDFPNCLACDCNAIGSLNNVCDVVSGNCTCKNNYGGRSCDICENGYYNYPSCTYCECDTRGTEPGVCDKDNGRCLCKEGYGGPRCDQCIPGYYGYPNCEPCNCSRNGTSSVTCDAAGKCSCLSNFVGKTCNQCAPGYYNYPECTGCNCDSHGSIGVSCDHEGKCQCRENFDGDRCEKCKANFYNFPNCEGCNCDPAGIAGTFQGCGSLPTGELCQCKERVEGRICNQCKKLFWNLQPNNPDGCEDCHCNIPGVIGSIGECDGKTGQCICKPTVTDRDCSECIDGTYDLQESNLFGCSECSCDIGGSLSTKCNKETGQCHCRNRIEGQTCNEPMRTQYFPTLHQYQYEAEDGRTPSNRSVRYGFAEDLFPGYSWKGYAVFSPLQNKIIHEIEIQKSSLYRIVLRYVNPNNEPILGSVTITPDSHTEVEQHFKVQFKSKTNDPSFVTVAGAQGNLPSVMVMNPGHWIVTIAIEKSLFLDYFVLLPSEYYEASILTQEVSTPCVIGYKGLCRHYAYPNLTPFDSVLATSGYTTGNDVKDPLVEHLTDQAMLDEIGESQLPLINDKQRKIHLEMTISIPGAYVLVITYVTSSTEQRRTATIFVEANVMDKGKATLHPCKYTSICRQVVTETNGKVAVFTFPSNYATIILDGEANIDVAIKSVVAIPADDWSVDYLNPKSVCVRKDGKCIQGMFPEAPDAKKIELEQNNQILSTVVTPVGVYDNSSKFIYLNSMIDVPAKVPHPGDYILVVQYYQPDYPEFNLDVLVQNGKFYEAKVPMAHCPSNSCCRNVVRQLDGNARFQLTENFVITLKENSGRGIWLDYILVIPVDLYSDNYLKKLQFDQTKEFIKKCGNNHFHINRTEEGFCRDSVFSLTANYNNGALPCSCDIDGTTSFECEKFGGQCPCKANIIGRRCNICKTGFYGFPNCRACNCPSTAICEPESGACICPSHVTGERCDQCEPGTYGYDPIIGCEECQCSPHGVLDGDLQCNLLTGNCMCKNNVVGRQCGNCRAGHYQFPYCEKCDCDTRGTTDDICDQETADCHCKPNVQGSACDHCKEGMFNLQPSNDKGCSECFCFGKTTRCASANLYRTFITDMSNWDLAHVNEKNETVEILRLKPQEVNENVVVEVTADIDQSNIVYFSAPPGYLNKKLTSYGGWLNYTVSYTIDSFGHAVPGADVILQGADSFLVYRAEEQPPSDVNYRASVQLVESNFETKQNLRATREQMMVVLGDLRGIYIRATYWQPSTLFALFHVSLDVATEAYLYNAELASSVEQCHCPPNYKGLSCEECAKGHYRVPGPYGGYCVKCQCNGHADTCDVNSGVCHDCKNGTTGDHCELCEEGYYGNATLGTPSDCLICACPLPIPSNNFARGCDVSDDGSRISCKCLSGYYGARCESCAAGYYGKPDVIGDFCKPCECSGNINTNEIGSCDSVSGECLRCLNNTYGAACNLCAPGFFGDAIEKKDCKSCFCDQCGMKRCDSYNGVCQCHENVIGDKCDRCADDHYGFSSCRGCQPCNCGVASESSQCADEDGNCRCKPGVEGRTCDQCMSGFWNYGPNGCTSCECTTGYSRGASCNPITGQCECLPGVLGEKCDHCPHRTVLDERRGCQHCDKCTHDLLDVTDELEQLLDPVSNSFKNVADSYFTNQRLDFINDTIVKLAPEVKLLDPRRIDFEPLHQDIARLNNKAYGLKRRVEFQEEDGSSWKSRAEKNLLDVNNLELDVSREINLVNAIINEVQALASNMELGSGPKIDNALRQAQEILGKIKQVSFTNDRDKATDQSNQANILVSEMISYEEPVKSLVQDTDDVSEKLRILSDQIDDMYNLTLEAEDHANNAERLTLENKKLVDASIVNVIKNATDRTNENLENADELNKISHGLYDEADYNFGHMKNNVIPGATTQANQKLSDTIDSVEEMLLDVRDLVPKANIYAQSLDQKSIELESLLTNTRNLTGVRAASVYQNIANNINEARLFAQEASKSADNATNLVIGLGDKSMTMQENSEDLLIGAVNAVNKTKNDLTPVVKNARNYDMPSISLQNDKNNVTLELIVKSLGSIFPQVSSTTFEEALNNADYADFAIGEAISNNINGKFDLIPDDLKKTKQLSKDTSDSIRDMSQANHQLDSMNTMLPDITNRLKVLSNKQQSINGSGNSLYDKIESLKRKISNARDLANRIRIGLTFFPNTTLELKNPESLPLQITSTKISVYFRTAKPNGFLMYLGNENRTNILGVKTHDFMALSIEGGYPVLTLDLGSGPQRIIGNRYVSDNKWRQLIVDRTGRNIKLIIRESVDDGQDMNFVTEQSLPGSHSIFNLDQEKSKLFVGGFPTSFQVQDAVVSSSFDGEMEELMIGDVPVSFWNFIDGENNWEPALERDTLVNLQPNTGYRFDREGYAILSKKNFQLPSDIKKFRIEFKFKTWVNNGLMYLMGEKKHFLSLELKDGYILYQFDLGDGQIAITTSERYNDGNWHTVEALRLERIGALKVDGKQMGQSESQGQGKNLISSDYVYFGGFPTSIQHSYKAVTQIGFEGCIDEVVFLETSIDLTKNVQAFGVMNGCPVKFASLVSFDGVHPGYVKWDRVQVPHSLQINLKFKTQSESGLIYHLVNADGSPASSLSLVSGRLVLESQGEHLETNSPDIRFNDNEWHVITATHNGTVLRLDIDDSEDESTNGAPYPREINDGALYVGNVPDHLKGELKIEPFVGCIGDTTLNGVIVNFANSTERPYAHLSQCNRPDQMISSYNDPSISAHPSPPPSSWQELTTNVADVGLGGEDAQAPGSIEGRIPGSDEDDSTMAAPVTVMQTTSPITAWPTSTREPETVDGCRLPYYPATDPDQFVENAWRFGTQENSRFEYNTLNGRYKDDYDFQIDIKTFANEGVVFYSSDLNRRDLIALYIKNGLVYYTYDCGSGPALLGSEKKINDHQWHTVYFKRLGVEGELVVDDQPPIYGKSVGTTESISVQPPFFVGGVDPTVSGNVLNTIGINKTFSGCIRNFMLNGQHVKEPSVQYGVIPCSKRVEPGMFFYPGSGSNWFRADDKYTVGRQMDIQMDIKPRSSSGLLLSIHGRNDHVVLEMVNGTIKFLVKAAKGQIETSYDAASPNSLCDGNWHNIRAVKQKNAVILSVDHKAAPPGIGNKNLGGVLSKHSIYIGGHPHLESGKPLRGSASRAQYVGCINNIVIKERAYPLDPSRIHGRVVADVCPTI